MKIFRSFSYCLLLVFLVSACNTKSESVRIVSISDTEVKLTDGSTYQYPADKKVSIYYLIRHAEKEKDGTDNPGLTQKGKDRAEALAKLMEPVSLDLIYSTQYKRTTSTVIPSATQQKTKIDYYDPQQMEVFVASRLKKMISKKILIVGHSNTTPALLNLLAGKEVYKTIPESEYNNLYIVAMRGRELLEVKTFKYF